MKNQMAWKQGLVFAALSLAWGSTWIASDALAQQLPPLTALAARFLLSAVCCIPLLARRPLPPPRARARLFLLSVTMMVLPLLLLRWARPLLPSATVAVLYAAMPLAVILLAPVLGEGDVPRAAMRASIVGLGGLLLATGATFSAAQAGAAAVVLLAVVSTGASSLWARRLLLDHSPIVAAAWVLGSAGLLFALAALVCERGQPAGWDRPALGWLLLLSLVGGAPAYLAWFWLLQRLPAYRAVTVQWLEPLVALAEASWLLRLGWSWTMIAGSAITFGSLVVLFRTRKEDDESVSLGGI